jgi:cytidylate kinase
MAKRIITISRQYGSGGREIGGLVAERLGYAYFDRELIKRAAEASDINEDLIKEDGEGKLGMLSTILSYANVVVGKDEDTLPLPDRMFLAQSHIIKQIADEGPCVIIGHSADYFLSDYSGRLSVFIHADWDSRVKRVMERNALSEHDAVARIRKIDRIRAVYYEQHTDQKWSMAPNYDLTLSSSYFGVEGTVEALVAIAQGMPD